MRPRSHVDAELVPLTHSVMLVLTSPLGRLETRVMIPWSDALTLGQCLLELAGQRLAQEDASLSDR
jgi:hypothetical protein